jgi:hypothetical protein
MGQFCCFIRAKRYTYLLVLKWCANTWPKSCLECRGMSLLVSEGMASTFEIYRGELAKRDFRQIKPIQT